VVRQTGAGQESAAILDYIDDTNMEKALDKLFKDIIETSGLFQGFLNACILVFFKKYLERDYEELVIPDPEKNVRDFFMPFYVKQD
jgi:hypothetical protein